MEHAWRCCALAGSLGHLPEAEALGGPERLRGELHPKRALHGVLWGPELASEMCLPV